MHFKKLIAQIVGAGAIIALSAGSAYASLLVNSTFDDQDLGGGAEGPAGVVDGWATYGDWGGPFVLSNFTDNGAPHTEGQMVKGFGPFGMFQDLAAAPGENWEASVYVRQSAPDPGVGNAGITIDWLDAGGTTLGLASEVSVDLVTAGSASWTFVQNFATAPAGTAFARIVAFGNTTAGTALVDTAFAISSPTVIPVPAAVWLFGSGLLGLVGVARRRKA